MGEQIKKGIDLSYHNGDIDFKAVKSSGIEFVILREGYRKAIDKKFLEYVKQCKEAGLQILGVYHFLYSENTSQAIEEARSCIANFQLADLPENTFIFSDFEYDTVKKALANGVHLTKDDCNNHTMSFCETIQEAGYKTGVYTNLDYYRNWYNESVKSRWPIWLADYKDGPDYDCIIQQYSSKGSIPGIKGNVDLNYLYEDFKIGEKPIVRSRNEVIRLANSWVGKNEEDGSYKEIIDIYNGYKGNFPRGTKMQYGWSWCACTWSALAIALGYTDIMPIEISCGELIKRAKSMGIWEEKDSYIPKPADAVLYDWQDTGVGDNQSWPDHVGTVEYVNEAAGYFTVIEGNYNDSVKKRTVSINGKFIRGFITPRYTDDTIVVESQGSIKDLDTIVKEIIAGKWGNGASRKNALIASGYNYDEIQKMVTICLNDSAAVSANPIQDQSQPYDKKVYATCSSKNYDGNLAGIYTTTGNVYCRNDAGTDKKALCVIPKGTEVNCFGGYTKRGETRWLSIRFILDGVLYTGFTSEKLLKK